MFDKINDYLELGQMTIFVVIATVLLGSCGVYFIYATPRYNAYFGQ